MNRRDFYKTSQWFKTSNSYRKHVFNICERCGVPTWRKNDKNYIRLKEQGEDVRFGIVHHKVHLNELNINDPYITLSFDNLELLCIECHNKEHMTQVAHEKSTSLSNSLHCSKIVVGLASTFKLATRI